MIRHAPLLHSADRDTDPVHVAELVSQERLADQIAGQQESRLQQPDLCVAVHAEPKTIGLAVWTIWHKPSACEIRHSTEFTANCATPK
jgi:hypothetical protein